MWTVQEIWQRVLPLNREKDLVYLKKEQNEIARWVRIVEHKKRVKHIAGVDVAEKKGFYTAVLPYLPFPN